MKIVLNLVGICTNPLYKRQIVLYNMIRASKVPDSADEEQLRRMDAELWGDYNV